MPNANRILLLLSYVTPAGAGKEPGKEEWVDFKHTSP